MRFVKSSPLQCMAQPVSAEETEYEAVKMQCCNAEHSCTAELDVKKREKEITQRGAVVLYVKRK